MCPQKKKSSGLRSGEREGQATGPCGIGQAILLRRYVAYAGTKRRQSDDVFMLDAFRLYFFCLSEWNATLCYMDVLSVFEGYPLKRCEDTLHLAKSSLPDYGYATIPPLFGDVCTLGQGRNERISSLEE
ncbi:hypothetical protein AVEN_124303-1 [Araneus ventricosus]|uniref:Uncharacterized protein n=1 Tax=Araneus ventricosus TaxID=182803 RepID=A0A4Y2LNZ7_ARAVE|nr:hypothetical protein AVEN_124303-1 [Araneus ventricosus]